MKKSLFYLGALLVLFVFLSPAQAADIFNLSYTLVEGGYKLELNEANPYKGVKLQISSNVSTRYEVIQRILKPLENRDDPNVLMRNNFVLRGLRGTNQFGDFRIPASDMPVRTEQVLYVSNANGAADSFTLVYGINRLQEIKPGHYFGRISFTLKPIGSIRSQATKILDVYVNISEQEAARPRIEIATFDGSRNIILNPHKTDLKSAEVLVKIDGSFKNPFSIIQVLTQPLQSAQGNRLAWESVSFVVTEVRKGTAINKITPLSLGMQKIYTSAPSAEADRYFVITYALEDLSGQKAGRYKSRLQYILEEKGIQTKLETLELEIEYERVFDLLITPQEQRYGITFLDVKPTEPPRKSEVEIEIITNIGKRYQVSQQLYSGLTSKDNNVIAPQYFTMFTQSLDTKGNLKVTQREEARKGSTVLFVSDEVGSADKFKVIYELECPQDLLAGDYTTKIVYSLSEI